MRSEHPSSEHDRVISRGRVLGGLEPTRAFGDARYKWTAELQGRLYDAFLPGGRSSVRGPPRGLETPPYVTAQPEVEWRRVTASSSEEKELKFIVMATDGLWDMISNEEVVALIAASLSGKKEGEIKSEELLKRCFNPEKLELEREKKSAVELVMEKQRNGNVNGNAERERERNQHPLSKSPQHLKTFTFRDENLSTHLIRNALGGANTERVAGLLAIPAPESRRYRDDVSMRSQSQRRSVYEAKIKGLERRKLEERYEVTPTANDS